MSLQPPEVDLLVGMEVYATRSAPCRGRIKVREGDFQVSEVLNVESVSQKPRDGYLPLYRVEKHGMDTFHMIRILSAELHSRLSYAGVKDKRAQAIQFVTPTSTRAKKPERVQQENFVAELVGYIPRPISRRMMLGNSFRILIREPCDSIRESTEEAYSTCSMRKIPNYFGLQRFGARDPVTHKVGKQVVLGRFDEAIRQLVFQPRAGDSRIAVEAREKAAGGSYKEAYRLFTDGQDLEKIVVRRLARNPNDFVGAFRSLPIAIRRFHVHAYESYLFNRMLSEALQEGVDISRAVHGDNWGTLGSDGLSLDALHGVKEVPRDDALLLAQIVGYTYRDYGSRLDRFTSCLLQEEGVRANQFYVKEAQEASAEGGFRSAPLVAKEFGFRREDKESALSFTLARGEYATVMLREILKPDDPVSSGFGS